MTTATIAAPPGWREDALPLYDYQVEGVEWIRRHGSGLIADEMGLGKTVQILRAFCEMRTRMPEAHLLVVAPNGLIGTWAEEVEKWTTLTYSVATGTARAREAGIDAYADVTVIAYDNLYRSIAHLNARGYQMVAYDEAHYLKNRRAQRTQAAMMLKTMRRYCMTGSPILNRVDELWPLLFLIDPVAYPNYWSFLNRYAVFGGYENKQVIGVQNAAELSAKLQPVMLRRLKKDVLASLPPKTITQRFCDLEPHYQKPLYRRVRDELLLEIEDATEEIKNPLTRLLRLKQIIGTPACVGGEDRSAKLDLCMQVLDEIGDDHKVVVFTQFRGVAKALAQRLDRAGVTYARFTGDEAQADRDAARQAFMTQPLPRGPRVLICSYGVAREGLTLTAASHAIMIDKLYVPAMQSQAEDRLHRPGAKDNVTIIELIANRTVDAKIEKMLASKRAVFEAVINEDALIRTLRDADAIRDLLAD